MRWRVRVAVVVLAALVVRCGRTPPGGRTIVLALDGMDPDVVGMLVSEGQLPHFARLVREGASGRLRSIPPLLSPIIWTTIATGKSAEIHGIGHFVAVDDQTGAALPVTSQMRRVKAIWNILSDAGRRVAVVGWWATWPAESVRGVMVTDHTSYHFLLSPGTNGEVDAAGTIAPPEIAAELRPLVRRPADMSASDVAPFIHVSAEDLARPFDFNDDVSHFRWALATGETYRRIGLHLWKTQHPDLLLVYLEGVDSVSHLFGHLFRAHDLAGDLAAQQARFGDAVEAMYRYADGFLGDFMDAMDTDTTLVVLSDHGFTLGALPDDPTTTRDLRRVSERSHRIDGIVYAYGRGVKPATRIENAGVLDVTPTLLALAGLPAADDMPGRVLETIVAGMPPPRVATYENGERAVTAGSHDAAVDPAIVARLQSLGYVGAHSPQSDRNLAAVAFQAGHYEEARQAYARLVTEHPDDPTLRTSLAGALGALGRLDDALAELAVAIERAPLRPEGHHNRAVIYERQGKTEAAIDEYRTALRYDPRYEPSRQALRRLTGSARTRQPTSPAEKMAAALAKRASALARRGDYPGAMKALDDAERIAPRWVTVYQYRANVAFLMGDRARAAAALRKALELEPDNALFQANLRRLEDGTAR